MIAGELDRSVREIERKISVCNAVFLRVYSQANDDAGYANSGSLLDLGHFTELIYELYFENRKL